MLIEVFVAVRFVATVLVSRTSWAAGGMSSRSVDMLKCQLGSSMLTLARKHATRLNAFDLPIETKSAHSITSFLKTVSRGPDKLDLSPRQVLLTGIRFPTRLALAIPRQGDLSRRRG
jgi:hypothetical protein